MDRRVQRTRDTLHRALISLMVEKGFDAITVHDILVRANVGRSTFYAHYRGKEDLLRAGLRNLRQELSTADRTPGAAARPRFAFSLALFEHAHAHRQVYRAIVGRRGGAVVMMEMRRLLRELVREEVKASPLGVAAREAPREAVVEFVVGALMSLLTWWLEGRADISPPQIDAMFRRLTLPGLELAASRGL